MSGDSGQHSLQETAKQDRALSVPSIIASRSSLSVASSRPVSPVTLPFRQNSSQLLGSLPGHSVGKPIYRFSDALTGLNNRPRTLSVEKESRPSTSSRRTEKTTNKDNGDAASFFNLDADPFAKNPSHNASTILPMTQEHAAAGTESAPGRKHRGSLLVAASDALGLSRVGTSLTKRKTTRSSDDNTSVVSSFGHPVLESQQQIPPRQQRKLLPWKGNWKAKGHWALQPPSSSQIMSDVIEISAANTATTSVRDDEEEMERRERDRLREAAAESIGISPLIREDASSRVTRSEDGFFNSTEAVDDDRQSHSTDGVTRESASVAVGETEHSSIRNFQRSGLGLGTRHNRSSSLSGAATPSNLPSPNNFVSLTPKSSLPASFVQSSVPVFPCTFSALEISSVKASSILKFYPSSTLLTRGFSRLWRSRVLVISSVATSGTTGLTRSFPFSQNHQESCHLHIFKSHNADEKEIERLRISQSSSSLMDQHFAGKRYVVKVNGIDLSGRRKEIDSGESNRDTWFISFSDVVEARDLVAALNDAASDKRYSETALGMSTYFASVSADSKDELDESSRLGRFQSSESAFNLDVLLPQRSVSPTPTVRSWAGDSKGRPVRMVSLKGLFSVPGRTRSMSHGTTQNDDSPTTPNDTSFASRGAQLLNLMRPGAHHTIDESTETKSSPATPTSAVFDVPQASIISGPILSPEELEANRLGGSKEQERPKPEWYSIQQRPTGNGHLPTMLSGSALMPPPRTRRTWTPVSPPPTQDHPTEASSRRSFQSTVSLRGARLSVDGSRTSAESFRIVAGSSNGPDSSPSQRHSRSSSLSSSFSPTDNGQSGLQGSALHRRRMSKLPMKLAPPAGPLPSVPSGLEGETRGYPLSAIDVIGVDATKTNAVRRHSESSHISANSTGTSQSNMSNLRRSFSAKRRSILPPQQPAPSSALPPTPSHSNVSEKSEHGDVPSPRRLSFRETITNRSLRFSTSATLPAKGHARPLDPLRRRSMSSGNSGASNGTTNDTSLPSPSPPPTGPLPPTPDSFTSNKYSLRERLRMRSVPSNPMGLRGASSPPTTMPGALPLVTVSSVASLRSEAKLGEPIIPKDSDFLILASTDASTPDREDDTNFLNLSSPVAAAHSIDIPSTPLESYPNRSPTDVEMTVLPAPPRRNRAGTLSGKDSEQEPRSLPTQATVASSFPALEPVHTI